jgi:RNA polymerase sigma-70 factor (ECF subfamily)
MAAIRANPGPLARRLQSAAVQANLASLVADASRGEVLAVDELLHRYLPGLRAFIRLRAGPLVRARESSSDIAQSVCREVLEQLDSFRYGGEAGFKSWLYTTALRKLAKRDAHWRALRRDAGREVEGDEALLGCYRTLSTPSLHAAAREWMARLEAAFDELSEDDREVITLARVCGLSHDEIARQMGRTPAATRLLLHRALAKLSEKLDDSTVDGN